MTIYTLGPPKNPRLKREYATTLEELRQLAIERLWGTLLEPGKDQFRVDIDFIKMTVKIRDRLYGGRAQYEIRMYERKLT